MDAEWKATAHEEPDVRTGRVLALVLGFVAFVAVLFGGLGVYYRAVLRDKTVEVGLRDFPAPRLQPNATQDYVNFSLAQEAELKPANDGAGGRSIEQAMAAVVARGSSAYDPVPGTQSAGPTLATGAALDGAPRAKPAAAVAPYGLRP